MIAGSKTTNARTGNRVGPACPVSQERKTNERSVG
jgi:hypothetical protein